jgi:hypothetical protein
MPKTDSPKPKTKKTRKTKKEKVQDRFMVVALKAGFPVAKSSEITDYDFSDKFAEWKLKSIGKATDRTVLGRGEFDKPYQQAKVITRNYAKYLSGAEDPDDATADEMITAFEKLEAQAEAWMQSDEAKWVDKDTGKKDNITQIKEIEARGMLHGAKVALFQLRNRAKLADQATQDLFTELEDAQQDLEDSNGSPDALDNYRAVDAKVLAHVCGTKKSSSGTSEVHLIKGPDGSVAYAFKAMKGESTMMGTPEGAGAVREVLMSKICEAIKAQKGPDFGWPRTTMASMDVGKPQPVQGVLVDGLKGEVFASEQPTDMDPNDYAALKERANQILPKLPEADVQKLALCNLAMGNYDIKWDNAMLETTTDGVKARPFDAGVAVPDLDTFMRLCHVGTTGGGGSLTSDSRIKNPGKGFTEDLDGNPLESATKKMDPALVQQFQNIDVDALEAAVAGEIQRLDQSHNTNCAQLGLDALNAFKVTAECLKATKKLLQDGNMTLEQFVQDYQTEMIDNLVAAKKDQWTAQWTQAMTTQYNQLKGQYPTLVYQNETDPKAMFMNWVSPGQVAKLQRILGWINPNDPNLRATYPKLALPGTSFGGTFATLHGQRKKSHVAVLKPAIAQLKSAPDDATAEGIAKNLLRQANVAFDDGEVAERVKAARRAGKQQNE